MSLFSDSLRNQVDGIFNGSVAGQIIDVIADQAMASNQFNLSGYSSSNYMRYAKNTVKTLVETPFLQGWQWRVHIEGQPDNLSVYMKDIDFGNGSIDADPIKVGSGEFQLPSSSGAGEITMTFRETPDLRVWNYVKGLMGRVRNQDGTLNLPCEYTFMLTVFVLDDQLNQHQMGKWRVYATKLGNVNFTREGHNQFVSYPVSFQKFSNIGHKVL